MNKKNISIILAVIVAILIIVLVISLKSDKNVNNSQGQTINQIATKKSNGIYEIYNTDIKTNTGSTKFTATVSNISGNKTEKQKIEIILLDTNKNEIGTILVTIPSMENGEITEVSAEDLKVYENIYDYKMN